MNAEMHIAAISPALNCFAGVLDEPTARKFENESFFNWMRLNTSGLEDVIEKKSFLELKLY